MPGIRPGTTDIHTIISSIINFTKTWYDPICSAPCEGLILTLHYKWTFYLLISGFLAVWYSWYYRDVIVCVSHFNSEVKLSPDYMNVCLSYPFIQTNEDERRYILFYRWISWSLLVLAWIYYIPRKVSKGFENAKCKKLIEDLASNTVCYNQSEAPSVEVAFEYMCFNMKTHNGLYWKFLTVNFICLLIDIFAIFYFNFILQNRFIGYGIEAYPYNRDPQSFQDYISQTFPPFVLCELNKENKLINERKEVFGCHLTIMELYEKFFLCLWVWLIILIIVTLIYIGFLFSIGLFSFMRKYMLRMYKPGHAQENVIYIIETVLHNCRIGDVYLLYRIKRQLSHARFYELLCKLTQHYQNVNNLDKVTIDKEKFPTIVTHSPTPQLAIYSQIPDPEYKPTNGLRSRIPNVMPS